MSTPRQPLPDKNHPIGTNDSSSPINRFTQFSSGFLFPLPEPTLYNIWICVHSTPTPPGQKSSDWHHDSSSQFNKFSKFSPCSCFPCQNPPYTYMEICCLYSIISYNKLGFSWFLSLLDLGFRVSTMQSNLSESSLNKTQKREEG